MIVWDLRTLAAAALGLSTVSAANASRREIVADAYLPLNWLVTRKWQSQTMQRETPGFDLTFSSRGRGGIGAFFCFGHRLVCHDNWWDRDPDQLTQDIGLVVLIDK